MDTSQRLGRILGVICLVISVTACNQNGSPTSPSTDGSSSSSTPPIAPPPSFNTAPRTGATIQGTVSNMTAPRRFTGLETTTILVKVIGTDITAPVSPTGTFVLVGVPAGTVQLEFTGGVTTTVPSVSTGDRIDVQIRLSGSTGVVESSIHIKADSSTVVDGTVTSVSGSCPNRTIVVNDWTLTLTNTSQGTCSDVRVGAKVKIKGTFTSNKTIVIVRLEINGKKSDDKDSDKDSDDKDSDDDDSDDDDSDDGDSDSDRRRRMLRSLRQFTLNW